MNMSLTIVFSLALTGNQHFFNVFVFRGKFRIVTLYFDKNSVNQTIVLQSLIDGTHVTLINDFSQLYVLFTHANINIQMERVVRSLNIDRIGWHSVPSITTLHTL